MTVHSAERVAAVVLAPMTVQAAAMMMVSSKHAHTPMRFRYIEMLDISKIAAVKRYFDISNNIGQTRTDFRRVSDSEVQVAAWPHP